MTPCLCNGATHESKLVVITGGPGAGKTAALEMARRTLCPHVEILPEAASILWRGGFPRLGTNVARRAAQRAIARVQVELQAIGLSTGAAIVLCDRGTLDGLAYWPGDAESYFAELETTIDRELARYAAVIHLRTPNRAHGYRTEALRPETAEEAAAIDLRLAEIWSGHPRRVFVANDPDGLRKIATTLAAIRDELPPCCRAYGV